MREINYIFLAILMMASLTGQCQYFHDAEIYELQGHVKSFTLSTGLECTTRNFSKEGKDEGTDLSKTVYNDNGFMSSCNIEYMGSTYNESFYYNSTNQLVKRVWAIPLSNKSENVEKQKETCYITEYVYDNDGTVIEQIETITAHGMTQTMTTQYVYDAFDSHGNWIRRTARVKNKNSLQIRTITYW